MIIFPAIDIKGGKCVRLLKGDFNKITQYKKSPIDQANEFSNSGFNNIHLIDLDGALAEKPVNENIIKEIKFYNCWKKWIEVKYVEAIGFEPPTPAFRTQCATGLRYASK